VLLGEAICFVLANTDAGCLNKGAEDRGEETLALKAAPKLCSLQLQRSVLISGISESYSCRGLDLAVSALLK